MRHVSAFLIRNWDSSAVIVLSFLLALHYQNNNFILWQSLALALVHLWILNRFQQSLALVPKAAAGDRHRLCYVMGMVIYMDCFLLVTLLWSSFLYFLPINELSTLLVMGNNYRLRASLYSLAIILGLVSNQILGLGHPPARQGMPIYYYRSIDIIFKKSFFLRYQLWTKPLMVASVISPAVFTICRFAGYGDWWLHSSLPWIGAPIAIAAACLLVYHFFYFYCTLRRVVKREAANPKLSRLPKPPKDA